jgi:hypothetical protein
MYMHTINVHAVFIQILEILYKCMFMSYDIFYDDDTDNRFIINNNNNNNNILQQ